MGIVDDLWEWWMVYENGEWGVGIVDGLWELWEWWMVCGNGGWCVGIVDDFLELWMFVASMDGLWELWKVCVNCGQFMGIVDGLCELWMICGNCGNGGWMVVDPHWMEFRSGSITMFVLCLKKLHIWLYAVFHAIGKRHVIGFLFLSHGESRCAEKKVSAYVNL